MKSTLHTLDNGLRILLIDTESFPSATSVLLIGAGSRYENDKNNGVAHFFEHMAFKGSKKYPNAFAISSVVDALGGQFNAFTSKDHTGYWIKSPTKHLETVADVLSDMVMHPLLEQKEIDKEKGVIVEEINMYEDAPSRNVWDVFEDVIYKGSSLQKPVIGTKDTVTSFDRAVFTSYIDELYKPSNAMYVIAGGLSTFEGGEERLKEMLTEKFSSWGDGAVQKAHMGLPDQTSSRLQIKHKKTEQVHFVLGFPSYPFADPRKYAAGLAAAVLGKGMSSRLFTEVREKRGLCYYIGSFVDQYVDAGAFVAYAGVKSDPKTVKEAIEVTLEQHRLLMEAPIQKKELEKAKEVLKGGFILALENSHFVATYFGTKLLLENESMSAESTLKLIDALTADEVADVAKDIFDPAKLNIGLIGDIQESDLAGVDKF